jgi:hypothetical protein
MRARRETKGVEYAVQVWNYGRRNWDTEDITYSLVEAVNAETALRRAGFPKVRVAKRHVTTQRSKWVEVA